MQVFVWFGVNSTEIEKKLAVKSAQVCTAILWNATYDVPVPSPPLPSPTHTHTHTQVYINYLQSQGEKRKLKIAKRGAEPWEFTRCFHGWVAT